MLRFSSFLITAALVLSTRRATAAEDYVYGALPVAGAVAGAAVGAIPYWLSRVAVDDAPLPEVWLGMGTARGFHAFTTDMRIRGMLSGGSLGFEGRGRSELVLGRLEGGSRPGFWAIRSDALLVSRLIHARHGELDLLCGGSLFPYFTFDGGGPPELAARRNETGGFAGGPMGGVRAALWPHRVLGVVHEASYASYAGAPFSTAIHNVRASATLIVAPWRYAPADHPALSFFAMYDHDRLFGGNEPRDQALTFGVRLAPGDEASPSKR